MDLIWLKRFNSFINDRIFLLRRLANGFAFLPLLIFLLGLYYYPIFLEWIPSGFPLTLSFAIVIAWFVTRGRFRCFINEADIVYLPPIEKRLKQFFQKCIYYNVIIQGFLVFSILIILSPLFFARVSMSAKSFILFMVIVIILKALNVVVLWQTLKVEVRFPFFVRLILNFIFIYGLLLKEPIMIITVFILATIFVYFAKRIYNNINRIHWLQLVENEQRLDARFYHWISIFVDHPRIISKVKQRKLLVRVTNWIRKKPEYAYHYLYLKIFFRSELMGIILRIVIIGFLMLWLLPNSLVLLGAYVVFLLIIGLQLYSFWYVFTNQFWVHIYPITESNRKKAFLSTSFYILFMVAIILLIPIFVTSSIQLIGISFFVALSIPYSFTYLYVNKKVRV